MRDLVADDPRSKFLRAYNILFGACVVRGVYPVINTMLGSMNCANLEFQGRNLNGTVESIVNSTKIVESLSEKQNACEEQALARPELELGAVLKNHLELLGGGLMVAARDTMVRLRMEDQVNFIEEKWSDKDFNILLQDLIKARQETGAAATYDEIYIYDQLMVWLRKLDRICDYFDDNLYT